MLKETTFPDVLESVEVSTESQKLKTVDDVKEKVEAADEIGT